MADNSTRIVITAEDKTRQAFDSVRAGLDGVGRSASTIAATVAGMAGLGGILSGVGISAMVKESIDAADAMNDLSQRIGIAVQDLAKYELAAKQSGTSMEAIARGVKGLAGSMLEHGDALKKAGITAKDADGAMRQLADLFARMPDGMEKTVLATKLFGKAGMDLIPMLNMGSKGLDESAQKSERYAAAMAVLAPQADKFNDQMAEIAMSGKVVGLTLANEVMPALTNISGAMAEAARDSGILMAMWVGLGGVMAEFGSKAPVRDLKIVNAELEATKKIMADLAPKRGQKQGLLNDLALGTYDEQWQESNQRYVTLLRERTQMENAAAASARKTASSTKTAATEANSAIAAWRKQYDELMKSLGGSSLTAKTAVDEFATVMNRVNAKDSGVDASFWKDLQALHAGYKAGRVDADAYADAVRNLTNQQGFAKDAAKAAADAEESIWKAREKAREEAERSLATLQGEIEQQKRHNEEIGLTAEALAQLTDRRMQDAIATKEQEFAKRQAEGADLAELKLIDEQIGALEKLRQLKSDGAARQAVADSAKQAADDWKKFSDDIERALTDSLMRGFENGESFGKNFVKSLQNTLKTAVLKMAVQAVVSPVMGGVNAAFGQQGAAGMANGGSGILGTANNLWTAYRSGEMMNTLGEFGAGASAYYGGASQVPGMSLGVDSGMLGNVSNAPGAAGWGATAAQYAPIAGGMAAGYNTAGRIGGVKGMAAGAAVGVGTAAAMGAAGSMMAGGTAAAGASSAMGTLSAMGPVGWVAAAALLAYSAFSKKGGGPQIGEYGGVDEKGYKSSFTASGGDPLNNKGFAEVTYGQAQSLYAMVGLDAGKITLEQGYGLDPQGDSPGKTYRNLRLNGKTLTGDTFDGNNGAQWYGGNADTQGAATYLSKLTNSEIEALVKAIDNTKLTEIMAKLKANFSDLTEGMAKYQTAQATQKSLLGAMMTDDERARMQLAAANETLASTFADLGQSVPDSAASMRALISGLDLTTQAGQDTLTQLAGVPDAFMLVANAAKAAEQEQNNWRLKLAIMEGQYTEQQADRFFALTGAADDATRAIMQQVYALEDQQAAASAAAEAAKLAADALAELASRAASVKSSAYSAYGSLLSATGNERGSLEFSISAAQEAYQQALAAVAGNAGISSAQAQDYIDSNGGMASAAAKYWNELGGAQDEATIRSKELLTELVNAASGVAQAQTALKSFAEQPVVVADTVRQVVDDTVRQVVDDTARAQQQIRDEWQRTADSIFDTIRKLRGDVASPAQSYAAAQAQFSIATAAARAGDQDAAGKLPQLAQSVVDLGKAIAVTRVDQQLLTARTIASLSATMEGMRQFGIEIPAFASGGYHAGGLRLVGESGPELEATGSARIYNFDQTRDMLTGGNDMRGMRQELIALRRELAALRADNSAENRAIASATAKTAKTMERFDDGDALTVRVSA